ncbi:multicopper oxidase domain-containing protein [Bacteroidia bacterium]|nr:multicopper oxidase domain-containing protein [Bacteroidia bacterium]
MKKGLLIFCCTLLYFASHSANTSRSLFIHGGNLIAVNDSLIPYVSFNEFDSFSQNNPVITLNLGDSLSLWVYNRDTIEHQFAIKNIDKPSISIPRLDSIHIDYFFSQAGNYIYYDPLNYPTNTFLGLAGMIAVKNHNYSSFYWNIKEHDKLWNTRIRAGAKVDWDTYYPKYFTINGKSNPMINEDSQARITGKVGDTLILYIANTGQSIHSIHFHGYHVTVLFSSKYTTHVGRSKDTCPVFPLESLVLQIIPDKPGEYPVHDHNLVAASANNTYPNGMFTTILITE